MILVIVGIFVGIGTETLMIWYFSTFHSIYRIKINGQEIDDDIVEGIEWLKRYRDLVSNANGTRLIEFFNEMSRFSGDYEGKKTFDGVMGKSIIVTIIIIIDCIKEFEVNSKYCNPEIIWNSRKRYAKYTFPS